MPKVLALEDYCTTVTDIYVAQTMQHGPLIM